MDVLKRIDDIMKKQNLTDYQLAKLSNLSLSTLSNMRRRNTVPSIQTLQTICNALGITLSQFFVDEDTELYPISPEQKPFFDYYIHLSDEQQHLLLELVKNMTGNRRADR